MAIDMAAYLPGTATADYTTTTLNLAPHSVMTEASEKNQEIHYADDGSEQRISHSDSNIFWVTLQWNNITEDEVGTIADFYYDSSKGNGIVRTFKWAHPTDSNTYIVRFDASVSRQIRTAGLYDISSIKLRVIDKVT